MVDKVRGCPDLVLAVSFISKIFRSHFLYFEMSHHGEYIGYNDSPERFHIITISTLKLVKKLKTKGKILAAVSFKFVTLITKGTLNLYVKVGVKS